VETFTMTGTGKATVETLQRLLAAFNAHDLDAVMGFFAEDPVLEMPRGPDPWGRRFQGARRCARGWPAGSPVSPDKIARRDSYWKLVER
jgi:ketosteroid isomerase-like protein